MRPHSFLTSSLLLGALLTSDGARAAVDESRLWLPRTQTQLRPDLVAAAQFAAQSEDCVEVVSGELDQARSSENAPVFNIVCRNKAGFTYGVWVQNAGTPNAELEKVFSVGSEVGTPSKLPSASGDNKSVGGNASVASTESHDEDTVLSHCEDALRRRTSGMAGVSIDVNNRRTTAPDGAVRYEFDFDAKDPSGEPLLFSAACRVGANAVVSVELHPRAKTGKALPSPTTQPDASVNPADATVKDKAADVPADADAGAAPAVRPAPASGTDKPQPDGDDGWEVVE